MDKVQVEILGLSSSPSAGGAYALLLREIYGQRRLPIIIGQFEAQAIALELEGIKPPRPLTHDLLKTFVDNLGGTVLDVFISELRDNTFYSEINIDISTIHNSIDARPSDAIALAVRSSSPIFVSESVMEIASFIPSENDTKDSFSQTEDKSTSKATQNETQSASLQDQLREAIEKEDYERAAKLRDEIDSISGSNN
ncbi:MAG: bifunctional nuclease family protein [Melioribacteraceae bacterium]|jgi:bifunctional DNase/RNase|nr:bifunctional nuclease family protein [Melioribacteraceae bacterium]